MAELLVAMSIGFLAGVIAGRYLESRRVLRAMDFSEEDQIFREASEGQGR